VISPMRNMNRLNNKMFALAKNIIGSTSSISAMLAK